MNTNHLRTWISGISHELIFDKALAFGGDKSHFVEQMGSDLHLLQMPNNNMLAYIQSTIRKQPNNGWKMLYYIK